MRVFFYYCFNSTNSYDSFRWNLCVKKNEQDEKKNGELNLVVKCVLVFQ